MHFGTVPIPPSPPSLIPRPAEALHHARGCEADGHGAAAAVVDVARAQEGAGGAVARVPGRALAASPGIIEGR